MKEIQIFLTHNSSSGGSIDFTQASPLLREFEAFKLNKIIITNKFDNIYESNKHFRMYEVYDSSTSATIDCSIADGNYTLSNFAIELQSTLNANSPSGATYSVTFSEITYKLTITCLGGTPAVVQFAIMSSITYVASTFKASGFERLFGVVPLAPSPQILSTALSWSSDNPVDLLGPQLLFITAENGFWSTSRDILYNLYVNNSSSPVALSNPSIVSFPITAPVFSQQVYEPQNPTIFYYGSHRLPLGAVVFNVVDEFDNRVDLKGGYCIFSLQLVRINVNEAFF